LGGGSVLPKVMRDYVDHVAPNLVQVAQALDVDISGMSERDAALEIWLIFYDFVRPASSATVHQDRQTR